MKLTGILFGLFAALTFSFAEANSTPLHCGGCAADEKKECDSKKECDKDKKDCDKKKCDKEEESKEA